MEYIFKLNIRAIRSSSQQRITPIEQVIGTTLAVVYYDDSYGRCDRGWNSRLEQNGCRHFAKGPPQREAVDSTLNDQAVYLNNLGNALQERFDQMGVMEYMNGTIATNNVAIDIMQNVHPDRVISLDNLATLYSDYSYGWVQWRI